ncbi:MAG: hypothetical protein IJ244_04930 [Bacteroidaceae bacterium]|nr:hypothetical protein [Bacteroidaceae bacterium]
MDNDDITLTADQEPQITPEETSVSEQKDGEGVTAASSVEPKQPEQSGARKMMEALGDDDEEHVEFTVSSILGGDILAASWLRRQVGFIIMVVLMIIVYITNRYTAQQALIKIDSLKSELAEIRYESMTRSSQLTQRTRQSKVVDYLKQTCDSTLGFTSQQPFIIKVKK